MELDVLVFAALQSSNVLVDHKVNTRGSIALDNEPDDGLKQLVMEELKNDDII